jgi:hypothetical protein
MDVPLFGQNVALQEGHLAAMQQTADFKRKAKTAVDMRRRIKQIYSWLQLNYPEYCEEGGVVSLTPEQQQDPAEHHFTNQFDLNYSRLNVYFIKAFIGSVKVKGNGKHCSFVHLRKFRDAVKFGAEEAHQDLPEDFDREMKQFLLSCKKEVTNEKKKGNLDEQESDPISFILYELICKWALESNNVLVWVWTVIQWNCMARSASIDPLGFHNISKGVDSIVIKYDDSKADNAGEKVSPKNIFANPFNPYICSFLSLGCYFCINRETFMTNDKIFQKRGKDGSAASTYCSQLSILILKYIEIVNAHARPDHSNTHGIRKGASLFATSGTTCPPPMSSVAKRGEWTLGQVFDLYFSFAEPGDCFLGRILAGLDAHSPDFAALPPHFKDDVKSHPAVVEAMMLCFGPIIETHDPQYSVSGILYFCLASMVHHIEFIAGKVAQNPQHQFAGIPLLHRADLLDELKGLVSMEEDMTMKATGIPPHVKQAETLKEILKLTQDTLKLIMSQTEDIKNTVREAIAANDVQSGLLTLPVLLEKLDAQQHLLARMVESKLREHLGNRTGITHGMRTDDASNNIFFDIDGFRVYKYDGKEYDVPKNWDFPSKVKRQVGWSLWHIGSPCCQMVDETGTLFDCPIKPYRLFKTTRLPPKVARKFKMDWRPIFDLMEGALMESANMDMSVLTIENLMQSFDLGTQHVRSQAEYIWELPNRRIDTWSIAQWSKMIKYSSIVRYGTDSDKEKLNAPGYRNNPRPRQRQRVE